MMQHRGLETVQNKKSADLFMRAQAHIDAGRHLEALQCYRKVIKIIPNSWDAGFRCGVLLFELQRYDEAPWDENRAGLVWQSTPRE